MKKEKYLYALFTLCLLGCSASKNTQDTDRAAESEIDDENSDYVEISSDEITEDNNYEETIIYDPSLIESLPDAVKEECNGILNGVATNIDGDLDKTFTIETKTVTQDVIYDAIRSQFSKDNVSYTWRIGVESIVINSNPFEGLEDRAEEIFTDVYKHKEDTHELAKYVSPQRIDSNLSKSDAEWTRGRAHNENEFTNCMILGTERGLTLVGINRREHYQGWDPNHTCTFMNYAYFEKVNGVWYVVSVR